MKRVLVVDPMIEGHHADYLLHLLRWAYSGFFEGEMILWVEATFDPIWRQEFGNTLPSTVQIHYFPEPDRTIWMNQNMVFRSFSMWKRVKAMANLWKVDHVLLMYLDIPQLGVSCAFRPKFQVSGILFRPNFHYPVTGWKAKVGQWGKKTLLALLLKRSFVQTIWTLDATAVQAPDFSSYPHFKVIRDPVRYIPQSEEKKVSARAFYRWPAGKKVFLLFGHLDERKGVTILLEAITRLSKEELQGSMFLLAGKLAPHLKPEIDHWLPLAQQVADVRTDFRSLAAEEIDVLFDLSDYILALYQRHVGMASVVVRAGLSGKPLWASDFGYLGHLVRDYALGKVVASEDPEAVAQSLREIVRRGIPFNPDSLERIAQEASPELFARRLLGDLP